MFAFFNKFKYFDQPLQVCTLLLLLIGLVLVYSISFNTGSLSTFWRQMTFVGAGILAFLFFSFFDYHTLAKSNRVIYVVFLLVLVYLLTFGSVIRGGRRWIDVSFFRFQPAEFTKIIIMLGLARLLSLMRGQINSWKKFLWSFFYAFVPASLILLEPDLGSTIIIMFIWGGMILISPVKKSFIAILLIVFVAFAGIGWKFFLKPFQKDRIKVFINPQLDPRGKGYNVRQASIAVGSGEIFGKGFGKGTQSGQNFLPERQTDFIFAATSEEIGFLGDAALLIIYAFLLQRLFVVIHKAKDDLGMYLAAGVFFFFFSHTLINVCMNIGLLPVTGIPLPFLSAGGSNLIVACIALGIAQNVSLQSKILRF